ncbi:Ankyrin repeat-containing protein [Glarea lozoyensis ATCC 20868]|uniref:Ankyrin repeat-containing protein n=1 Tax=Glarea lozoyensis (strain ATCC 20868 / MF5171) TaxID=1116229 RepID=S3CF32_GLAL2|nr:Ankyrin repeat-containing protein [Glarea lozoyensis ATCC 20868]EPE24595.1 Ankyrin repeat-containing protein [Glarea lozoyensis ATCC 20868]
MALETLPFRPEAKRVSILTLTSLPFDLFTKIIAEILATIGVRKAVRLRQVSPEICFDYTCRCHGIVDEVLEKYSLSYGDFKTFDEKLAGRLLQTKMEHEPNHEVLSHIKESIERLPDFASETKEAKLKICRDVCEAAAPQIGRLRERDSNGFHRLCLRAMQRVKDGSLNIIPQKESYEVVRSQQSQTDLSIAIVADRHDVVRNLIESGVATVDFKSLYFKHPIVQAARLGRIEIVKYLLEKGAEWQTQDEIWSKKAYHLISLLDLHINKKIMLAPEPTISSLGLARHKIELLLRPVAHSGNANIFTRLLDAYKDESVCSETMKSTLIREAIIGGNTATLSVMVKEGFEIQTYPLYLPSQTSYLQIAAQYGSAKMTALLLEHGADPRQASPLNNLDAWDIAITKGYEDVLKVLLDHAEKNGVQPSPTDLRIQDLEHAHIIRMLIRHGYEIGKDPSYENISKVMLRNAFKKNNVCMVEALVEAGVSVDIEDINILADLVASSIGRGEMIQLLLRTGAANRDGGNGSVRLKSLGRAALHTDRTTYWELGRY